MPDPTAPPEFPVNPQIKFKNHKKYLKIGNLGFHPGKLGVP